VDGDLPVMGGDGPGSQSKEWPRSCSV